MLAHQRGTPTITNRRLAELDERPWITHRTTELRMLHILEIVARPKLLTFDDVFDGRDRREQEAFFDREPQKFSLGVTGGERRQDPAGAIVFGDRPRTARERQPEADPIFVASRFIAPTVLAQVAHQFRGKHAERRSEQEGA